MASGAEYLASIYGTEKDKYATPPASHHLCFSHAVPCVFILSLCAVTWGPDL